MAHQLLLVCDDAGYACVDRGIRALVDSASVPVCAEYLIERDGAAERAKEMSKHPLVSIGIHFELSDISDADRVMLSKKFQASGSSLGEQADIRAMAERDARRQLERFREELGCDPTHISTHGNFNVDRNDHVMPWWTELMDELFSDGVPPMQLAFPLVRHNYYSWNCAGTKHHPCTPEEFAMRLVMFHECDCVEFVVHPALPEEGDASLDMLFTADMRTKDLEAAITILQSGIIQKEGFDIVPVTSVGRSRPLS